MVSLQTLVDSWLTDAFSTHDLIYIEMPRLNWTLVKQLGNYPISGYDWQEKQQKNWMSVY